MRNKIILAVVLILIVGAIWYLQTRKASPGNSLSSGAVPIALPDNPEDISRLQEDMESAPASDTSTTPADRSRVAATLASVAAEDKKAGHQSAAEIADPTGFINTEPFTLASLVGKKVILLDFWTYSCINCIRTMPHLNSWYEKYKDQGLEIVGIHTPEFEFEKVHDNVKTAVEKYGIKFPVVLDNNYGTWNAYSNRYWPHHFLIDIAGYVVDHHIGEGAYEETEEKIQKLLAQRAEVLGVQVSVPASGSQVAEADLSGVGSPETYFGYLRNQLLGNGKSQVPGEQTLPEPVVVVPNNLYLVGTWNFAQDYAANKSAGARVIYKYRSDNVYFVASSDQAATIRVMQDGQPISASSAGKDVVDGKVTIQESRLYHLIDNSAGSGEHTLELIFEAPNIQAYTFTFG